ncbi:hypothetical protein HAX54_015377 [Datura stramonium]|uniref:Uncharacterized protein n=1 Tax=Datura stramonium TaxID=4076 RepID=A0ABS8S041_DATST|nr:hypothetical protein [Datura stramonium]
MQLTDEERESGEKNLQEEEDYDMDFIDVAKLRATRMKSLAFAQIGLYIDNEVSTSSTLTPECQFTFPQMYHMIHNITRCAFHGAPITFFMLYLYKRWGNCMLFEMGVGLHFWSLGHPFVLYV